MTQTFETLVADGWLRYDVPEGYSSTIAPFWYRVVEGVLSLGLIVEKRHLNEHLGTLHGGASMTFADVCGGFAVVTALGHNRIATLQLQTHFTAAAREGDFVHCTPELVRQTKDVIFVRGMFQAGERTTLAFDGIWKILAER